MKHVDFVEVDGFRLRLSIDGAGRPKRLSGPARIIDRLLDLLGYREVDLLGISWGGTLAQELALRYPQRVARLVLVATTPGWLSVPGRPKALMVPATPRRYDSPTSFEKIAPILYGGAARDRPELLREQGHLRLATPRSRSCPAADSFSCSRTPRRSRRASPRSSRRNERPSEPENKSGSPRNAERRPHVAARMPRCCRSAKHRRRPDRPRRPP